MNKHYIYVQGLPPLCCRVYDKETEPNFPNLAVCQLWKETLKVELQLNKTVYDMKFIVNLTRNDSQKRQKRQKRHIFASCFFPSARVNRARG